MDEMHSREHCSPGFLQLYSNYYIGFARLCSAAVYLRKVSAKQNNVIKLKGVFGSLRGQTLVMIGSYTNL